MIWPWTGFPTWSLVMSRCRKKMALRCAKTLKRDSRTSHIPIILLTAKTSTDARIRGFGEGADAYLPKPFNEEELSVRIEQLLELRKNLQQRYQQMGYLLKSGPSTAKTGFEKEDAFMKKLQQTVDEHLADLNFGTTQLCEAMGMSRSHLHLKIKALTNKSTSVFIRTIRLHKARQLLQQGHLNVSQVAMEVGFRNLSYFSRKFSEEFGYPPNKLIHS